ncbi:MAG TPA: tetratricopeptide repeat protein, partial [Polyangiaceae bacterium]
MTAVSLFEKAVQFHRAGQIDRAERLYRDVLAKAPEHGDALFLLSVIAMQTGRLEDAAALLEHAVRVTPNNALYLSNLGDVYRSLGRSSEAITVLLVAIARKPDFAEAVFNLAVAFEERGDLEAATLCFERAQELAPDTTQAAEQLTKLRAKREALASAAASVRPSGPQSSLSAPDGLAALAETLRLGGRPDDATVWYRMALQLNPRMPNAHTALGAIHAQAGHFDAAIEHFRRALEIDENFHIARGYLATALDGSGLIDEAQAIYRQAVALFPGDPVAHSTLLFNMPFWPNVTEAEILSESRAWNARHASPLATQARPLNNERS